MWRCSCLCVSNIFDIHKEEIIYFPKKKKEEKRIFMKACRNTKNGLLDGFLEIYNKDGTLKEKRLYQNGVLENKIIETFNDGSYNVYFPNSTKISIKYTKELTQIYSIEGKLIEEKKYKNNILITHIYYGVFTEVNSSDETDEDGKKEKIKPKRKKVTINYDEKGIFLNEIID